MSIYSSSDPQLLTASLLRRNHGQHDIILVPTTKVQVVHSSEDLLTPILRVVVPKNSRALRITTRDLQDQLPALLNHNIGGPDLNVNLVDSVGFDFLHVRAEVLAVRQVLAMTRVVGVHFAQTRAEPAFGQRDWVAGCAGVEDLFAFWRDVTEGQEEVYV